LVAFHCNAGLRTCRCFSRFFHNARHHHARGAINPKKLLRVFYSPDSAPHARAAYYRAIQPFMAWADRAGYQDLEDIEPITVAAYIETLGHQAAPPTANQRMTAADMLKQAGLPTHYPPHSFRATGITNFLENDGLEGLVRPVKSTAVPTALNVKMLLLSGTI
jgi:hypothetical protein